jgi:adenylate kinase
MRLLIIGPPGSGKGTQARKLSDKLGIVAISTGDMFRAHLSQQTALGIEVKMYLDSGDFVPDRITNALVRERLKEHDTASGFLLDGYPRTARQAKELDNALRSSGGRLDAALELAVDDEEVVRRLSLRARTQGRHDDTEGVIRHRLQLYRKETEAVLDRYKSRGLLLRIDGTGEVSSVTATALKSINARVRPNHESDNPIYEGV